MGILAAASGAASAEELGRVISTTPVMQQVGVPRQVCSQPVAVQQPSSGGGAVVGAIVGGLLGNTIGHGMGRAAATGAGLVAGAAIGDSIEGRSQPQAVQQCSTQMSYENRTTGYNVVYEYAGKQFSVQLPYDPGQTIRLQLTPVGAGSAPPSAVGTPVPSAAQPVIVAPPVGSAGASMVQSDQPAQPGQAVAYVVSMPVAYPAPAAYYAPAYAPAYYGAAPYFPIGLSLGFGFSGGHRHQHGHRHWRLDARLPLRRNRAFVADRDGVILISRVVDTIGLLHDVAELDVEKAADLRYGDGAALVGAGPVSDLLATHVAERHLYLFLRGVGLGAGRVCARSGLVGTEIQPHDFQLRVRIHRGKHFVVAEAATVVVGRHLGRVADHGADLARAPPAVGACVDLALGIGKAVVAGLGHGAPGVGGGRLRMGEAEKQQASAGNEQFLHRIPSSCCSALYAEGTAAGSRWRAGG
jgi:uncharacterized protein YcfJ